MSYDRLNEIGHILEGAGSDEAFVSLTAQQIQLLGLADSKETVSVTEEQIVASDDHQPKRVSKKVTKPALQKHDKTPGAMVNVGVARTALELKLEGRGLSGTVQPEEPMRPTPETVEEVVS